MELTGEHRITAPRQAVWQALHDPDVLKECIKGCKKLDMTDDGKMDAVVEAKVGPVKATFNADVEIVNEVAPESYTLQGEGKGGAAGFAKGSADVHLAEDGPDATILTFKADAKIGGKLAQLGSRLVDTTAKKYATDFFSCLSEKLNAPAAETAAAAPTPPDAAPPSAATMPGGTVPPGGTGVPVTGEKGKSAMGPVAWAIVIVAVVAAILYFVAI